MANLKRKVTNIKIAKWEEQKHKSAQKVARRHLKLKEIQNHLWKLFSPSREGNPKTPSHLCILVGQNPWK